MAQVYRTNLRRDRRRSLPVMSVTLGEVTYTTRDWSLGGLALQGADPLLEDGETVEGHVAEEGGAPHRFAAVVVRHDPEGDVVALKFTELAPSTFAFLERLQTRARLPEGSSGPPEETAPPEETGSPEGTGSPEETGPPEETGG
jgi:hypothetical protein